MIHEKSESKMARICCFDLCLRFENLLVGSPKRTKFELLTGVRGALGIAIV